MYTLHIHANTYIAPNKMVQQRHRTFSKLLYNPYTAVTAYD